MSLAELLAQKLLLINRNALIHQDRNQKGQGAVHPAAGQHGDAGEIEDAAQIQGVAHQRVGPGGVQFRRDRRDLVGARGAQRRVAAGDQPHAGARHSDAKRKNEPGHVGGLGAKRTHRPVKIGNHHTEENDVLQELAAHFE